MQLTTKVLKLVQSQLSQKTPKRPLTPGHRYQRNRRLLLGFFSSSPSSEPQLCSLHFPSLSNTQLLDCNLSTKCFRRKRKAQGSRLKKFCYRRSSYDVCSSSPIYTVRTSCTVHMNSKNIRELQRIGGLAKMLYRF